MSGPRSAGAALVETTTSSVSAFVETEQIQNLPLNGRSFDELALLQPAVTVSKFARAQIQSGFTTRISIRGARPEQNSWLLDGTDVMGPTNSVPGSVGGQSIGVDTVREFKVETTTFTAQYGRAAGGVVNVITKSGTNELHGTAFEFLRNDNLDARNFFDAEKPGFTRNQFGGSLGGPIFRDKTFFFGSYEGLRERLGQTLVSTVPKAETRDGLITDRDGNVTQTVTVNPAIRPFLDLFPLPNGELLDGGTGLLLSGFSRPTTEDFFTAKVDHSFSESDSFFGRYTFDDGERTSSDDFSFIKEGTQSRNQFLTLSETHIFSPSLLNTFRAGYNRSVTDLSPEVDLDEALLEKLSFIPGTGNPLFLTGSALQPRSGISALGSANIPRVWTWNLFEWADDLTYTTGRHTVKAGVNIERIQFNREDSLNGGGRLQFNSLADFLQGRTRAIDVKSLEAQNGLFSKFLFWVVHSG